tara:strand:- start:29516 stop:29767 length:252 start_codon:yes stop_codon:yes gene_type:complete
MISCYQGSKRSPKEGDLVMISLLGNRYHRRLGVITSLGLAESVDLVIAGSSDCDARRVVVRPMHLVYMQSATTSGTISVSGDK